MEQCNICRKPLNSWDKRISKALAYVCPVCEECIATEYDMQKEEVRKRMEDFFGMRPCQGL